MNISKLPIVTSSKLFLDKNYEKIDEEGLWSQRIFGNIKSWHCECGALTSKILHADKVCDNCGVRCTNNIVRYTSFAKIILPYPIFKNTINNRSLLYRIIPRNKRFILDPIKSDMSQTATNFLRLGSDNKLKVVDKFDQDCIPIRITGMYSLYLAIKVIYEKYNHPKAKEILKIFTNELLVTPPGTRFVLVMSKNSNKQLLKHDLNKSYSVILKLCAYDWSQAADVFQQERDFVNEVTNNLYSQVYLQNETAENIAYLDQIVCKYQYYVNQIYKLIFESLSGKKGYIRKDLLGKTIDFSARAHITIDPALQAYEIRIPRAIFIRLWFIEYLKFLYTYKGINLEKLKPYVKFTEQQKLNEEYLNYIDEFIEYFFTSDEIHPNKKIVIMNRQPTQPGPSYGDVRRSPCELLESP